LINIGEKEITQIRNYPHILGHLVGKDKLTQLHSFMIRYIWDTNDFRSLQAHRGAYKSTAILQIGCVWWLLFNPDDRIAIIRKSYNDASELLKTISNILKMETIQYIFYNVQGKIPRLIIDRDNKLTLEAKKTSTPEGNIDAYGIDTGITGKHYDKIICDDIITIRDRISKAEREKVKLIVQELQTNIIDPRKPISFVGTPWHKDDAWGLCPKPLQYDVYTTKILTAEDIQAKKKLTSPSLFSANYELEHIASEDTMFKDLTFKRWSFTEKTGCYSHLDAKYSGQDTNGLTFMEKKKDGRIQAIGFTSTEHIDKWIDSGFVKSKVCKYKCKMMYNETNADKGYLAENISDQGIRVDTYHERLNKHIKISTFLYRHWSEIDWDPDTDPEYLNQILDYMEGSEPDDCPDSASSLIRKMLYDDDNDLWQL